jgi:hypothetical protein
LDWFLVKLSESAGLEPNWLVLIAMFRRDRGIINIVHIEHFIPFLHIFMFYQSQFSKQGFLFSLLGPYITPDVETMLLRINLPFRKSL